MMQEMQTEAVPFRRAAHAPLPPSPAEMRWAAAALAKIARMEAQVEAAEAALAETFQNKSTAWERAAAELSRAEAALVAARREFFFHD